MPEPFIPPGITTSFKCRSRWDASEGFHATWHHRCGRNAHLDGACECEFCGAMIEKTRTRLAR